MSFITVSDVYLAVSKGLHIDCYDNLKHTFFEVPSKAGLEENDYITDIIISNDSKYLASITSTSKQLTICNLPLTGETKSLVLPRSASKIRFTENNSQILVADKSGDVLLYDIKSGECGTKLLGHLSLLLDVLQTKDKKYVITSDRDEKIRVSCFPNTYNIQTYCLGHKEFVNHLEILPHNVNFLTSSSGDGTIKCWNYVNGILAYSMNISVDVEDDKLKENFTKIMDEDGVEVNTLPIVHYTATALNEDCSLLAVAVHSYDQLLIYSLETKNDKFIHRKEENLVLDFFPAAIKFHKDMLIVYNNIESSATFFKIFQNNNKISFNFDKKIKMFDDKSVQSEVRSSIEFIKVLYKRKFDNVQEYQERKRQRLEKTLQ